MSAGLCDDMPLILAPRGDLSNGQCPECEGTKVDPRLAFAVEPCRTCSGTGLAEQCMDCGAQPGEPCDRYCRQDVS